MLYIFSNVYRFNSDRDLVDAIEKEISPVDGDSFMFLNECIPLMHSLPYMKKFDLMTLHRKAGEEERWFGYDKIRHCSVKIRKILRVDDDGVVMDDHGGKYAELDFSDYPTGKVPTTGYMAYLLVKGTMPNVEHRFVNFYGMDDASARKGVSIHDWAFEDGHFRKMRSDGTSIFVEPPTTSPRPRPDGREAVNPYFWGSQRR